MEVLFEYRGSRRALTVADSENVAGVVGNELRRVGKPRASVFTANDELPSRQRVQPDIYLLQKWSTQWDCYVDVVHCNEICDGDRLAVIAKPKPSSKVTVYCLTELRDCAVIMPFVFWLSIHKLYNYLHL